MNDLDYKLLESLAEGEMLRLRYTRRGDAPEFGFTVEGVAADSDPGRNSMPHRIGIALSALRPYGLSFDESPEADKADGDDGGSPPGSRWTEIRPQGTRFRRSGGTLGFGSASGKPDAARALTLPALGSAYPVRLAGSPLRLVRDARGIRAVEIDFTRIALPEDAAGLMDSALGMGLPDVLALLRDPALMTPHQRYLGLWLLHRSGWRVECRALVDDSTDEATALLEALGREIHGVECRVPAAMPSLSEDGDFRNCHPLGWPFPPLLPDASIQGELDALALQNPDTPKLPATGVAIGEVDGQTVRMPLASRDRHTYLLGATGTGKSTLLKRMILDDVKRGEAVVLIDPHGDLYAQVLESLPAPSRRRLLAIDVNQPEPPLGFNILDIPGGPLHSRQCDFVISELIEFFKQLWGSNPEAFGPMFELYFRNTLLLMLHRENSGEPLDITQFERIMGDREFRAGLIESCPLASVRDFWKNIAEKAGGETSLQNVAPYITCKIAALTQNSYLARLLGAKRDELQLARRMDNRRIVLVNLNKGMLGAHGCRLIGTLLATRLFSAGLARSLRPASERRPVNVYIDEFQNFVSPSLAEMFSEARKFGIRLNVANQTLGQLEEKTLGSILGNVGNMLLFRLGVLDSERLRLFLDPFSIKQMQSLPNYHALARLLTPDGPLPPFVMRTLEGPAHKTPAAHGRKAPASRPILANASPPSNCNYLPFDGAS